jgi:hypothetical protein
MRSFPKVGQRLSRVALAGLIVTTAKFSGVGHRSRFATTQTRVGCIDRPQEALGLTRIGVFPMRDTDAPNGNRFVREVGPTSAS